MARRGIEATWPGGRAEVSMSGCLWVGRLLGEERRYRHAQDDLVPMDVALPLLRRAVTAYLGDDLSPQDELDSRANFLDIRGNWATIDETWRESRVLGLDGFDLFRLCGQVAPGMDLARFRTWLDAAYQSVVGLPGRLGINPAVPVPVPDPEPENVIVRGGRKILVEAVG